MSDLKDLINKLSEISNNLEKGFEDGLRVAGTRVAGKAKEKLGNYQPSVGGYPAWKSLKPQSVRRKFLSKSKNFHINEYGQVRINITRAGRKHLAKYGRKSNTFYGAQDQFQASGTSDDSPLVDTGILKKSITTDDSGVSRGHMYIGTSGVPQAAAQEFGSPKKNIPPRPYLRPSVYECKEEIENDIKEAIANSIRLR